MRVIVYGFNLRYLGCQGGVGSNLSIDSKVRQEDNYETYQWNNVSSSHQIIILCNQILPATRPRETGEASKLSNGIGANSGRVHEQTV